VLFNAVFSAVTATRKIVLLKAALSLDKSSNTKERITTAFFLSENSSLSDAERFVLIDAASTISRNPLPSPKKQPIPRWAFAVLWLYIGCPLGLLVVSDNSFHSEARIYIKVGERIRNALRDAPSRLRSAADDLRKAANEGNPKKTERFIVEIGMMLSAMKKETDTVERSLQLSPHLKELMDSLKGGQESFRSFTADGVGTSFAANELEKIASQLEHNLELKALIKSAIEALKNEKYEELKDALEDLKGYISNSKKSIGDAERILKAEGGIPLPFEPSGNIPSTATEAHSDAGEISKQEEILLPSDSERYPENLKNVIRAYFSRQKPR
jgi:hypothetical protein